MIPPMPNPNTDRNAVKNHCGISTTIPNLPRDGISKLPSIEERLEDPTAIALPPALFRRFSEGRLEAIFDRLLKRLLYFLPEEPERLSQIELPSEEQFKHPLLGPRDLRAHLVDRRAHVGARRDPTIARTELVHASEDSTVDHALFVPDFLRLLPLHANRDHRPAPPSRHVDRAHDGIPASVDILDAHQITRSAKTRDCRVANSCPLEGAV